MAYEYVDIFQQSLHLQQNFFSINKKILFCISPVVVVYSRSSDGDLEEMVTAKIGEHTVAM